MEVERENDAIRELVTGPHCIFALSPIEYPNERQQRYFKAYSAIFAVLRNEPEPDRTFQEMIFRNASSNLRTIVLGLLYYSLLNQQEHRKVFSHIQLLRNEGMKLYVECVTEMLGQGFSELKEECTQLFPQICQDLARYKLLSQEAVTLLLKTINAVDPTERHMNYSWKVLEGLQEVVKDAGSIRGFGRYIFMKLFKLLTVLFVMVDEEGLHEFREDCQRMAEQLWQLDSEECLFCGNEVFRYFQELIPYAGRHPPLERLMREYKQKYPAVQLRTLSLAWHERERLLGVNLVYKVTQLLHYLQTLRDPAQIDYQLSWLYRQLELNKSFDFLVIDMLRYVLRVLDNNESKFILLNRFITHCWSKPILYECARQAFFFDWFVMGAPSNDRLWDMALPGMRVLQMELNSRANIFQRMLEYVLLQQSRTDDPQARMKDNLRRILLLAQSKGLIQWQAVMTHPIISAPIKHELARLLSAKPIQAQQQQTQYNPFEQEEPSRDNIVEKEIDWEQEQYNSSVSHVSGSLPTTNNQDLDDYLQLQLEKEFVEETGSKLSLLLDKPTKDSYQQLIECVIGLIRKANQRNQTETISMFYSETVKLTYVMFQSHFEEFWLVDRDTNVLGWLIEKMQAGWGCTSLELLFYRRIIRQLGKVFRITPYATTFMLLFRVGHHRAHAKELLQFLTEGIPKESLGRTLKLLIDQPKTLSETAQKAQPFGIRLPQ